MKPYFLFLPFGLKTASPSEKCCPRSKSQGIAICPD